VKFITKAAPAAALRILVSRILKLVKPSKPEVLPDFGTPGTPFLNLGESVQKKEIQNEKIYKESARPVPGVPNPGEIIICGDLKNPVPGVPNPFPDGWTREIALAPGFSTFEEQYEFAQSLLPEPTRWTN
jgi:hypothetical protein